MFSDGAEATTLVVEVNEDRVGVPIVLPAVLAVGRRKRSGVHSLVEGGVRKSADREHVCRAQSAGKIQINKGSSGQYMPPPRLRHSE